MVQNMISTNWVYIVLWKVLHDARMFVDGISIKGNVERGSFTNPGFPRPTGLVNEQYMRRDFNEYIK